MVFLEIFDHLSGNVSVEGDVTIGAGGLTNIGFRRSLIIGAAIVNRTKRIRPTNILSFLNLVNITDEVISSLSVAAVSIITA